MRRWSIKTVFLWIGIPVLAAILALVAHYSRGAHRDSPNPDIGAVERADVTQQVTVAGSVLPYRRSLITPPYNAYVKKLYVHVGQRLKQDEPVLTLAQSLRGGGEELYPLRAPFAGEVMQVLHTEGEYVETGKDGNGVVRIDDLSKLLVDSNVPESDIAKIRVGQDVRIKVNAILDRQFHGIIREIALAAADKKDWGRTAVEFEVKMELLDPTPLVHPGMSTIVDIITARHQHVLTLPHEFIEKRGDNYFVTLEDGTRKAIQVGLQDEDRFEIMDGLRENDLVRKVDFANLPVEN